MQYMGGTGLSRGEDVEGDQIGNGEDEARSGKVSVRCVLGCSKL